jgi:hypothetical protein
MKSGTGRVITAICSVTTLAIAIVLLIYAAGAKLATIEGEIKHVQARLVSIEDTLEEMRDGRPSADATGRGRGIAGASRVGYAEPVLRLLPLGAGDDTDGALVLHGNMSDPE